MGAPRSAAIHPGPMNNPPTPDTTTPAKPDTKLAFAGRLVLGLVILILGMAGLMQLPGFDPISPRPGQATAAP